MPPRKSAKNNSHDDHDGSKPKEDTSSEGKSREEEENANNAGALSSSDGSGDGSAVSLSLECMKGNQIRQAAQKLPQSSLNPYSDTKKRSLMATASSSHSKFTDNSNAKVVGDYQSYQDASSVRTIPAATTFSNFKATTKPQTNGAGINSVGARSCDCGNDESVEGLSVADVASLAFNCVARCLTESYRAASNYYVGYQQQNQYPSLSGGSLNDSHNYQHVVSYQDNNYSNSNEDGDKNNGFTGSYEAKFSDNPKRHWEVMERGLPQKNAQILRKDMEQATQQEEWATVQVPSTYQGGRVGGGHFID